MRKYRKEYITNNKGATDMRNSYHYIVVECRKHGLTTYAYGIFRGRQLVDKGVFLSRELAETTGMRISSKLNSATTRVAA